MKLILLLILAFVSAYADSKEDFGTCMLSPLVERRKCFMYFRILYQKELHQYCFLHRTGVDNADTREACKEYAFMLYV